MKKVETATPVASELVIPNITLDDLSPEQLSVLKDIERSRDMEIAINALEDVFNPEFNVDTATKREVSEVHIRTFQKMWLPEEYQERQTDAYSLSAYKYSRARATFDLDERAKIESQAHSIIFDYEDKLARDPVAQMMRVEVQLALYDNLSDEHQDEFAQLTGLIISEKEQSQTVPEQVSTLRSNILYLRGLGKRALSRLAPRVFDEFEEAA